jgi:hypothetical protein
MHSAMHSPVAGLVRDLDAVVDGVDAPATGTAPSAYLRTLRLAQVCKGERS